jgi:AcrR family transcriptional regulator
MRAGETRERIIAAGAALLHDHPVWDFDTITVRAVATRAEVNERTVYRHFAGERDLRDAVFRRLEEESGLVIEEVDLTELQQFTEEVLEYVSSFPFEPRGPRDPTLMAAHGRQRAALQAAVRRAQPRWSEPDRTIAAAVLDVLWSVASYERLVADWGVEPKEAVRAATWAIGLVAAAIREDRTPPIG